MADNVSLFEKLVRTTVNDTAKDRPPTEQELKDACSRVRKMLPNITDEESDAWSKSFSPFSMSLWTPAL